MQDRKLSNAELLELSRWNLPAIYNGWEKVTQRNRMDCQLNWEDITDFSPQLGTMAGYAVTMEYRCSSEKEQRENANNTYEYLRYIASVPGPKIVITNDLDGPNFKGSLFGEVMARTYNALGCIGGITGGTARDIDEANRVGFKMLAKRLFVGHGYCYPVRWGCEITVCGCKVIPGQLVFADKYGFMVIPEDEQIGLLEATRYLDSNELNHSISTAQATSGKSLEETLEMLLAAHQAQRGNSALFTLRK
ncbi:MAG: RraA family protein [Planctomycetes bacterium]|nr:RraA family protein [Planctomycetota bacterium]